MDYDRHREGTAARTCGAARQQQVFRPSALHKHIQHARTVDDVHKHRPRLRNSLRGHVRYTANPNGVDAVKMWASASNWASMICTGVVEVMEWRARCMSVARREGR